MKAKALILFLTLAGLLPLVSNAQLVSDGQTNVLDNVATNVTGGIIIGTNGGFTWLVITNGATVTNSGGNSVIGLNSAANSNHVVVANAGSVWNNGVNNNFNVGQSGSANELDILNGGLVQASSSSIGNTSASSGNLALISGAGSVWTNTFSLTVGDGSSLNTMIVTNGGKVFSGSGNVGDSGNGINSNSVVITGAGSSWRSGYTYLGYIGNGIGRNQFLVNHGGAFTSSSYLDIGVYSSSNNFTVTDTNSTVQCQNFRMGNASTANQCIVSNGATLAVLSASPATVIEGTFTVATVTGEGSVWTNAGDLDFGQYSNTLAITSCGKLVDNYGYIENGSGKPNAVIVAGTNSVWKNLFDLHVADLGAQLLITNGGAVSDVNGYLGDKAGNNNCYALVSGAYSV